MGQFFQNGLFGSPVPVGVDLGPLQHVAFVYGLLELLVGYEVVVYAFLFDPAWLSGGHGNRKIGYAGRNKLLADGAFAGSGGSGYYE